MRRVLGATLFVVALAAGASPVGQAVATAATRTQDRPAVLDLWEAGQATFGVFVPNERPRPPRTAGARQGGGARQPPLYTSAGGAALAANDLYDYVFLNLEGSYDVAAVVAIAAGLRSVASDRRVALLVRIPPLERDGVDTTRLRVEEILAAGADGVVFPHIRGPEEAAIATRLMVDAGADVWSSSNPSGTKITMIMIEDPESVRRVNETAGVEGISVLACGIGSLRGALDGDRLAAEQGNQEVLAAANG